MDNMEEDFTPEIDAAEKRKVAEEIKQELLDRFGSTAKYNPDTGGMDIVKSESYATTLK